ncbi:MAG: extracellular solute-binding protein [Candidatus Binataceae bacterium]
MTIFNADSLSGLMRDLGAQFKLEHPGAQVHAEGSGSLDAIRKVTDLHLPGDMVISADWRLLAKPRSGIDRWVIIFAGNSMGLLYTNGSKYAKEITAENWYRVITRPGVRYGYSNPERDPAGYWTLILWRLAERYYHRPGLAARLAADCPPSNIRPHSIYLIALLQSGELDYYFGYASDARLGNLDFLALPSAINLGDFAKKTAYQAVTIEIGSGARRHRIQGAPIAFGATLTSNPANPKGALAFMKLMLSRQGQKLVRKNGLIAYPQCFAFDPGHTMPAELNSLCRPLAQ